MTNIDSEKGSDLKSSSVVQEPQLDLAEGDLVLEGVNGAVLARNFNLVSACATGITTGNSWAVLGAGIVRIILEISLP